MPFPKYGVFMAFIVGFPVLAVAAAKQKVISGLAVLFESQPQTATDSGGGQIAGDASSSTALANMRHATLVFEKNPEYAVKINTREGEQGLLLRVMKGIDSLILKTSRQPNWNLLPEAPPLLCSTLPGGRLNMTYDAWFNKIFKRNMRKLFEQNSCAVYWNENALSWNTCCELVVNAEKVGYCGSNFALEIANPCRRPEQNFDYGTRGSMRLYNKAPPNGGNDGMWRCPHSRSLTVSVRPKNSTHNALPRQQKMSGGVPLWRGNKGGLNMNVSRMHRDPKTIVTAIRNRRLLTLRASMDQKGEVFLISGSAETPFVTLPRPVEIGSGICSKREWHGANAPACFNLCCDTAYAKTTFCMSAKACF